MFLNRIKFTMPLYYPIITIIIFITYIAYSSLLYTLLSTFITITLLYIYTQYLIINQEPKWWQIKIDPSVFNINLWLKENQSEPTFFWTQRQFYLKTDFYFDRLIKKSVKKGHKVIIWVHNNPIGIYAFGEVLENSLISNTIIDSRYYTQLNKHEEYETYVKIRLTKIFQNNPIDNHQLWIHGLSRFTESIFDVWLNRDLPNKLPILRRGGSVEQLTSSTAYHGKIDPWGWIPIKYIDLEVGTKLESLYV